MKTILKRFISSLFIVIMCFGCSDDNKKFDELDPNGNVVTRGFVSFAKINLTVDLSIKDASVTKADALDTQKFYVTIINKKDNTVVGEWIKSEMPEKVEIYTGDYTVQCRNLNNHKSGVWEQPFYQGTQDFKVSEGATTTIDNIVCRMANVSVKVNFGEQFIKDMLDYRVSVTNGRGILTYTSEETRIGHFDPGTIIASLQGTRFDNTPITKVVTIPGATAGDAHVINFNLTSKGSATIVIEVDVTVNDKVVNVEIDDDGAIIDPNPDPDPDPDPDPENPEAKLPSIQGVGFDISQTMTLASGATKVVDVKVLAPNGGIKTLDVVIDSPTLGPLLDGLGIPTTLDLVTPTPDVKKILQDLKLIGTEPVGGKTEFQFSIGSFMPLLPIGTHKFKVVLVDDAGNKVSETLTIIVS